MQNPALTGFPLQFGGDQSGARFQEKLRRESDFIWLETGSFSGAAPSRYSALAGIGVLSEFTAQTKDDMVGLNDFIHKNHGKWIVGHLSYESRFLIEPALAGGITISDGFTPISFFVPKFVWNPLKYGSHLLDQEIQSLLPIEDWLGDIPAISSNITINPEFREETLHGEAEYSAALNKIFHHLQRGDIYEMNYCIPFIAKGMMRDPVSVWREMQNQQLAPFSALYRRGQNWLLCSSPERWLMRNGNTLISQPIKGTARRGTFDAEDEHSKNTLFNSEKERAENVMIVDLVRNDLGRIAETGTVSVDELFGIYSFPAVHQMISTISASISPSVDFTAILKALFPMGSMTGAPKISAMDIIRETEVFQRGLYSGSVGYIDPEGNFDFNVIIRSILYNEASGMALFPAGSAITVHCDPKAEYHECLLKSNSMRRALGLPLSV